MTRTTVVNNTIPSSYPQQSYAPQSLVQPYTPDAAHDARIRPLQPEFAYQQVRL